MQKNIFKNENVHVTYDNDDKCIIVVDMISMRPHPTLTTNSHNIKEAKQFIRSMPDDGETFNDIVAILDHYELSPEPFCGE